MNAIEEDVKSIVDKLDNDGVNFKDNTVLITGGAGFLGSWICDVLIHQGAKVICADNFSSGRSENVQHLLNSKNFSLVEHDISEPLHLDEHIDLVLHFASRASPLEFSKFPIEILKANTFGTWVALEIAKESKARFVFASSSEVYGNPDKKYVPTLENYHGNVNPTGPRSCYDEGKRVGETFSIAYKNQYGIDVRIVRIFNCYGPRLRPGDLYGRVVSRFIEQAMKGETLTIFGNGMQTRSFIYVTDLIEGILKFSSTPIAADEIINLGSDEEIKIIDLARIIAKLFHSEPKMEFHQLPKDDPLRRCPNIEKAKKILRWEPRTSLEQGLVKTISWYRKKYNLRRHSIKTE